MPTQSLAAITGTDLGDHTLGPMSNWTITPIQSSKMFSNTSPHITFTHTTNPRGLLGGHARA
ncbi:hypothetical protein ACFQ1S_01640 [Kibdelosporangium lantanae]|uniref:Uncharacterized protein n=1 Tax=Kibdelosporangium lantanae TaxID=1497396 RepID=A0ABW3M136_9PSEU